jgi:hypothetical protein
MLEMANTIKNGINLNLQEKKITSNDLTSFFEFFVLIFSNKTGRARIKKLVKTFWKIAILTENPINFDVTCSVILSTV